MRNITITILCCLLSSFSFAGRIDFNAVNFGQYADSQSLTWLLEIVNDYDTIGVRLRVDKTQANYLEAEDIERVIELNNMSHARNIFIEVTFTANLWATPQINLDGVNELKSAGVNCEKIELGNEWYSVSKDLTGRIDWSYYINVAQPIVNLIESAYPSMKFCFPSCPNPLDGDMSNGKGRKDHKEWNDGLAAYLLNKDSRYGVVWHTYYNEFAWSDLKTYESGIPKQVYNPSTYNEFLDDVYTEMYDTLSVSNLYEDVRGYCDTKFPNRYVDMTEYGIGSTGNYRNTLVYGAITFKDLIENRENFRAMYHHAGVALVGFIKPKSKFDSDSISSKNIRCVEYWTLKLANEIPLGTTEVQSDNSVNREGDFHFYFTISKNERIPLFTVPIGYYIESSSMSYIYGAFYYSSAGSTEWMANGSQKSYSITGITRSQNYVVPANAYGYIKVTVKKIPLVEGCTDATAINYNPLANKDDGSCYYKTDCGCKITTATNYNADSPCEDNSICKCRKKLFGLFSYSVKCKK